MTKTELVERLLQRGPYALDQPLSVGDAVELLDMCGLLEQDLSRAVCTRCRQVLPWPGGFANHSQAPGAGTLYVCRACAGRG